MSKSYRQLDCTGCIFWVWVQVILVWLTSFSSQAHPIGQNREAGVVKEARAGQVHLRGLQSKLLQLLGQQAKLFALAATFLFQISYLWLHTRCNRHTVNFISLRRSIHLRGNCVLRWIWVFYCNTSVMWRDLNPEGPIFMAVQRRAQRAPSWP